MLHDEHLPQKWPGENPRRTANTLVDGIAHARQRMGDAALGLLRLFAANHHKSLSMNTLQLKAGISN
jgi:hypothetical protein